MSPVHLFRQGTLLIFASPLEGNESTRPKVTWRNHPGSCLLGLTILSSSSCSMHHDSGPYHCGKIDSVDTYIVQISNCSFRNLSTNNGVTFITCLLNAKLMSSWGEIIIYMHVKYLKGYDQRDDKNLYFPQ